MLHKSLLTLLVSVVSLTCLQAQTMSEQVLNFLQDLPPELRETTVFTMPAEERRTFVYVPAIRKGTPLSKFSEQQKAQIRNILKTSLSEKGYWKSQEIMALEEVLFELENNQYKMSDGSLLRDPLKYHFFVFGNPAGESPWGWKFEGHHLSLNFTLSGSEIVSGTPAFMGSNPAVIRENGSIRLQVLRQETELGFALVNSLSNEQLSIARFSDVASGGIVTRMEPRARLLDPAGIAYSDLNEQQKRMFRELLNVYIDNYQLGFADKLRNKIENAGIESLSFAWAGALEPGNGHYYRIQGANLLIEYDNTQNNGNHVHTVVRDLTNDFAEEILRMHYENEHKE